MSVDELMGGCSSNLQVFGVLTNSPPDFSPELGEGAAVLRPLHDPRPSIGQIPLPQAAGAQWQTSR
jgi:hypothetical protein